jgi:hypothetical protein
MSCTFCQNKLVSHKRFFRYGPYFVISTSFIGAHSLDSICLLTIEASGGWGWDATSVNTTLERITTRVNKPVISWLFQMRSYSCQSVYDLMDSTLNISFLRGANQFRMVFFTSKLGLSQTVGISNFHGWI